MAGTNSHVAWTAAVALDTFNTDHLTQHLAGLSLHGHPIAS